MMPAGSLAAPAAAESKGGSPIRFEWGVKIPLRDGVERNATPYRPLAQSAPLPCVFTLTPYIGAGYHARGTYFAAPGYVFTTVDVRACGNSGGACQPMKQEAADGHDVVESFA
jgi:predicted acyl esterase